MSVSNRFVLKGAEENPLYPNEYGRWTTRWGHDMAMGLVRDLSDPKYKDHQKIDVVRENILAFLIHNSALYAAAYNSYAISILGVPASIASSVRQGVTIGFTEWIMSVKDFSSSLRKDLLGIYFGVYDKYVMTLIQDYEEIQSRDPAVYYPDAGKADKDFLDFVMSVYWENVRPTAIEENEFEFLHITDRVISLYGVANNDIGISYVA